MLEDDNTNNPKRFWSFIKSKRAESTGMAPLRKEGILYSNGNAKANILNDQFTSVFSHELPGEVPTKGVSPHSAVPDINITASGVLQSSGWPVSHDLVTLFRLMLHYTFTRVRKTDFPK
jgi:hypothetical protein